MGQLPTKIEERPSASTIDMALLVRRTFIAKRRRVGVVIVIC